MRLSSPICGIFSNTAGAAKVAGAVTLVAVVVVVVMGIVQFLRCGLFTALPNRMPRPHTSPACLCGYLAACQQPRYLLGRQAGITAVPRSLEPQGCVSGLAQIHVQKARGGLAVLITAIAAELLLCGVSVVRAQAL